MNVLEAEATTTTTTTTTDHYHQSPGEVGENGRGADLAWILQPGAKIAGNIHDSPFLQFHVPVLCFPGGGSVVPPATCLPSARFSPPLLLSLPLVILLSLPRHLVTSSPRLSTFSPSHEPPFFTASPSSPFPVSLVSSSPVVVLFSPSEAKCTPSVQCQCRQLQSS